MGKYMFADPLDLIMIYRRNICSNVPHLPLSPPMSPPTVSFIFNQSEWIRNGPASYRNPRVCRRPKLKSADLILKINIISSLMMEIYFGLVSQAPSLRRRRGYHQDTIFPRRLDYWLGNNLSEISVYLSCGRQQLLGKIIPPGGLL